MKPVQLLFILASLALGSFTYAVDASYIEAPYINVTGYGEVTAYPDYLTLSIQLTATEEKVVDAKNKVDRAFNALTQAAYKMGVKKKDIESVTINNYPQWNYNNSSSKRRIVGYRVERPVTINLRTLDDYGQFLEKALIDDGVQINNTQLKFSNMKILQAKARELALKDAKQKAEDMAKVLGQEVTGVLYIQEQGNYRPQPIYMQQARMTSASVEMADSIGSEMQIQDQRIQQQVQVRFKIAPKTTQP